MTVKEHCRYIKLNNPKSAYATHILHNLHEYGLAENTVQLVQHCNINNRLIHWENFYIQNYSNNNKLINEQFKPDYNILYDLTKYTQRTGATVNHQSIQQHTI